MRVKKKYTNNRSLGEIVKMRKKRNSALDYRYNPFLISFISFALIACLALSLLFLFMMYKQSQSFSQDYYRKKATTILDDFQTQLTSLENFSDKLMINKNYMYSTVFKEKYNEYALLADFKQYRSFSFLTENMFLLYQGCDHVFRSSGDAVFADVFWRSLSDEERSTVDSILEEPGTQTEVLFMADNVYILVPFRADYGIHASKAILGSVVSSQELEKHFLLSSGPIDGKVALYKDGTLIFSNTDDTAVESWKNSVSSTSSDGMYTIFLAPESSSFLSRSAYVQMLPALFVILLIFWLAFLFAQRVFKPLQDIAEKYPSNNPVDEGSASGNVYERLEGIVDTALQNSLAAAVQVEQNQEMLKRHFLKSLLNGAYIQDAQAYLDKLNIQLPGPFYYMIVVGFPPNVGAVSLSSVQNEIKKASSFMENARIYAIDEDTARQVWVICSIAERDAEEDLTESILDVVNAYSYKISVGIGRVYEGIENLHISWLESMDNLAKSGQNQPLEYNTKDLHWMTEAFAQGSEEIALRELEKYISRVQEGPQSMLMQLYIFSEFIGELGRLSRANGITMSSHTISLIQASRSIDAFYGAAREAVVEYCRKYNELLISSNDSNAQQICAYIQEHFTEYGLSIEKVSIDLRVQTADVRNAVKTLTGKKYTDYVTFLRMKYAKELLSKGKIPISDICEAVGYSSVSYFIRIFKEETGMTPAKYRKEKGAFPDSDSIPEIQ